MASPLNASAYLVAMARRLPVYTAEQLQTLTKPSFVNGHWRPPALNARAVKKLRTAALINGVEFPLPERPSWNDKMDMQKKPKGKKFLVEKAKRQETIKKNMANMPAMIEDYHKERQAARAAKHAEPRAVPLVPELPQDWMLQSVMRWPALTVPAWPAVQAAQKAKDAAREAARENAKKPVAEPKAAPAKKGGKK
eukprot:m.230379 g.230379  ORF g.230379 m.230379 type:complete len:195 (+) comp12052_c0_seq1:3-587(+)